VERHATIKDFEIVLVETAFDHIATLGLIALVATAGEHQQ